MEDNYCYLFYLQVEELLSDPLFTSFFQQIPPSFQAEIIQYKNKKSAQASLLGKIVLQYALNTLSLSYTLHDVKIGEKERPYLDGSIDFNISHSSSIILLGICQRMRIGVDIEKHREINVDLFKKYFSEAEWNAIGKAEHPASVFFDIWTMKESAIKCDGRGVEILSQTYVEDFHSNKIRCAENYYYYQPISITEKFSACICTPEKLNVEIRAIRLEELIR